MKKILLIFLTLVICLGVVSCNNSDNTKKDDTNNLEGTPAASDTNEIELNAENIYNYIAFDIKLENIARWSSMSMNGERASGFGKCDIVLDVFAKKPVSFDDVKITFDLVPDREEYTTIAEKELQLKYDGTSTDTYMYSCNVEGDNPKFEVVVKEVTGKVITK